ncbi:hypothetical protein AX15_004972 [Amanita polypyramis BW_CC]|nr:hypothetical protein AX15_004972 [Amanita polypyramis BW_CC]
MGPESSRKHHAEEELRGDEAEDDNVYGPSHFGQFGEYMRRKRAKLQIQNTALAQSDDAKNSGIFNGLSIYINGWTEPSVQELRQLIVQNGGIYQPYLDRKSLVTHIVTCSLTPAKLREFQNLKVVLPKWIMESVKQRKLLPWQNYRYLQGDRVESAQGIPVQRRTVLSFNVKDSASKSGIRGPFSKQSADELSTASPLNANKPSIETRNESTESGGSVSYAAESSNSIAQKALADPNWRSAHTSAAPDFVEEYYRNSRLHYLSTWKAELRALISEAQERTEQVEGITLTAVGRDTPEIVENDDAALHDICSANIGVMLSPLEIKMRDSDSGTFKPIGKRADGYIDRVIMHCDFDCFFVSAGLTTRPHLRGKPVAVCHSQGAQDDVSSTSEVACASYEAREQGVRNGMSLRQARMLCPNVVTIPYEFERYWKLSLQFYSILLRHADDIQAVSVDEALIDVTAAVRELNPEHCPSIPLQPCGHDVAKALAETIRTQVRDATGCEVSIGIAHNILLARLATRRAKPAGSFHISCSKAPDDTLQFLSPLDISDLPGFGYAAKKKALGKLGSSNIEKLREVSKERLGEVFGRVNGETLWGFVRGIDRRPLERDGGRRSVSCEINYGIRFANNDEAESFIYQMAKEVKKRLDNIGMSGRLLTLKVLKRSPSAPVEPSKFLGCGKCDSFSRQAQLFGPGGQATSDDKIIAQLSWRLLKLFSFDPQELRGIGIQIQRLETTTRRDRTETTVRGQGTLPFTKAESPLNQKPKCSLKDTASLDQRGKDRKSMAEVPGGSIVPDGVNQATTQNLELPSFSQVDPSVYDALPEDIRRELDAEYKRRSTSRYSDTGLSRITVNVDSLQRERDHNRHSPKRITHQLAPGTTRPSLSSQKSNLYQIAKSKVAALHVSEVELRTLGLDPDVFCGLPEEVQREQLVRARILKGKGGDLDVQTQKKVLKPRKLPSLPAEQRRQLSPPRAKFKDPLILRQHSKQGERRSLSETHEIQNAIGDWVERYRYWAPKEKDVRFFAKYLVQCVDGTAMGDDGIEKATAVMKWWQILLRRHWGAHETVEGDAEPATQVDRVGEAWWQAFRGVKEQLDSEVRRKFGGSISLK